MIAGDTAVARSLKELALSDLDLNTGRLAAPKNEFWRKLRAVGSEIWLDTGDIEEATKLWTGEMTALTTNNTLLNKEVQKGIYDSFITKANKVLSGLPLAERVLDIAFVLNARHGLRLVQRFGGKVSVELHTDLADDLAGILEYGRRFHEISPDHFIVKVPLTATGLLGARKLREAGIPVNFTLEFSARQNAVVTAVAKPNYVNVFLGRLGSYVSDNKLGDGAFVGEKATLASQRIVRSLGARFREPTKQIGASIRSADQIESLAGIDVFTIPTKVVEQARASLSGTFTSRLAEEYPISVAPGVSLKEIGLEKLWDVSGDLLALAESLDKEPPETGAGVAARAREFRCADMFPALSSEARGFLASEGKIPRHARWADAVGRGELAIDTLLNLAGLASFTADQAALDGRIRSLIA